jgi:hypothetical protein
LPEIVDLEKARLDYAVKRAFRNWKSQFEEDFGSDTLLQHISHKTLVFLVRGMGESTFYLYDLIMNLQNLGSGFEFRQLNSKEGMAVMDRYLFLLDRIRFEYMRRLGWLESYPGENFSLVELIIHFDEMAPSLQTKPPLLNRQHAAYDVFCDMNISEREEFIRKLIPEALKKAQDHSTTL